jgi:hypothetical protein
MLVVFGSVSRLCGQVRVVSLGKQPNQSTDNHPNQPTNHTQTHARGILEGDGGPDDGHVDDLHERRRHQRRQGPVVVLCVFV